MTVKFCLHLCRLTPVWGGPDLFLSIDKLCNASIIGKQPTEIALKTEA
jgi:hypothetical protein